jgi:hypothetical protein
MVCDKGLQVHSREDEDKPQGSCHFLMFRSVSTPIFFTVFHPLKPSEGAIAIVWSEALSGYTYCKINVKI